MWRRRYTRRYYGRRRRYTRRYNKSSFRSRILKAIVPPKIWVKEDDAHLDMSSGRFFFWAPTAHLHRPDLETSWNDTGQGGVKLVDISNTSASANLERSHFQITFRNLNLHPMYIRVYWLVAKEDIHLDTAADITKLAIDKLYEGWHNILLDTDESAVSLANPAGANSNLSTTMKTLSLYHSQPLRDLFQIRRGKSRWLQAGQSLTASYSTRKPRRMNLNLINDDNVKTRRGLTVIPMIRVYMSLGRDSTTESQIAQLTGNVHAQYLKKITWRYNNPHQPLMALTDSKNDTFTVGGQAPADDVMAADA